MESVPVHGRRLSNEMELEVHGCLDAYYGAFGAVGACVLFEQWSSADAHSEFTGLVRDVQPYQPGRFYKRELPVLLAVLHEVPMSLDTLIVDGYVWLYDGSTPGLGAKLYQALNEKVPVIGVAKNRLVIGAEAALVYRGRSRRPLYVTSAGINREAAAMHIREMHGRNRIPTMLKHVDKLCREATRSSSTSS